VIVPNAAADEGFESLRAPQAQHSQGFVTTETLRWFTPEKCAALLAKLP
jgi:hypothetical protein